MLPFLSSPFMCHELFAEIHLVQFCLFICGRLAKSKNGKNEIILTQQVKWSSWLYYLIYIFELNISIFLSLFIYFERETECTSERGAEREGERILSRLCSVSSEPDVGLRFTNHEIMNPAENKSQTLTRLKHPGTPKYISFNIYCLIYLNHTFNHLRMLMKAWHPNFAMTTASVVTGQCLLSEW